MAGEHEARSEREITVAKETSAADRIAELAFNLTAGQQKEKNAIFGRAGNLFLINLATKKFVKNLMLLFNTWEGSRSSYGKSCGQNRSDLPDLRVFTSIMV